MSKERELLKRWFNDFGIIQADIKLLRETQELLAQPEQEDIYREPLTDEEVRAKYRDIALDNPLYVPSYYAGFRDAEKAHGIGGGE